MNQLSRLCLTGIVALAVNLSVAAVPAAAASPAAHPQAKVVQAVHHDISPALRDMRGTAPTSTSPAVRPNRQVSRPAASGPTLVRPEDSKAVASVPAPAVNFAGLGDSFPGFTVMSAPPDTNGAVGPNHYIQTVNGGFAIFNKAGGVVQAPRFINTLWAGFGGLCQTNEDGDPIVLYDRIADRWLIAQFAITGANGTTVPFLTCVAVSTTADPTGAYSRYSFPDANFPDYPKIGVWPDGYYITTNEFNAAGTAFLGAGIGVFDRARMLGGLSATEQFFQQPAALGLAPLPSDLDSPILPPAGAPNHLVGLGAGANQLATWNFHVDFAVPANTTLSGPANLTTDPFTPLCQGFPRNTCVPQLGTSQLLDSLGDRAMFRLGYRNFGDHESMVIDHSVVAGASGGVRWYELRMSAGLPAIYQQGTYAPDGSYRWMGSIAMDQAGDIGLGFSISSTALHPGIHYTGRLASDPLGTMPQGEGVIIDGAGSQTTTLSRWGDYSAMTVDPADNCTFWYTTEYIPVNGTFNWRTRIASFRFPSCAPRAPNDFSISVAPPSRTIVQGAGTTYTVSTAATVGAPGGITLSVSGLPAGATASFSPNPVPAGSPSTMTVSTATDTPLGTFPLTVTGYASTNTHSAATSLIVAATTFYFAEGFTGTGFQETISLLMPNRSGTATIDYYTQSAHTAGTVALTAGQVATVDVNAVVGTFQQVSIKVTLPFPGVAERRLSFQLGNWHGSTGKVGASAASTEWDFAEGSTLSVFSQYLTLQNPNPVAATATLSYFTDTGLAPVKTLSLPPSSRTTVEVFNGSATNTPGCLPNGPGANCGVGMGFGGVSVRVTADQAIIAERPFYVNGLSYGSGLINDGHDAFGANAPGLTWNFAEGTTLGGFKEYLTLLNSGTADAHASLNYQTTGGTNVKPVLVPAHTRVTVQVFDNVNGVGPGIQGVSVQVTSDQPIVAERPMYIVLDFGSGRVAGAHVVVGSPALGRIFGFATASTMSGENDFLTLQNPGGVGANVTLTYYKSGAPVVRTLVVLANTRSTVQVFDNVQGVGPGVQPLGIVVSSDQPILVEKPTYSSNSGSYGATDTLGYQPPGGF